VAVSTNTISTIAGTGTASYSGDNGQATSATLNGPVEVASDTLGNVYIVDFSNNCIRKVTLSTSIITTIAGSCSTNTGYSGDNNQATSAVLNAPQHEYTKGLLACRPTKNSKGKKASKGRGSKNSHMAKHRRRAGRKHDNVPAIDRTEPLQMIAQNQEKKRMSDSAHKEVFVNASKEEEGYFATLFSHQKKTTTFQTIEGTAAVFKSVSGWEDKKFYILTNELPVGTLVRITTPDLKSICAKVISALPEVSSNIKYRLNDAAAAILGITNKTFPISVTY
jgi:hypothetical protein